MTREMRENQMKAERQTKLSQYSSCVLRVQFPCRHIVQGIFPPETKISEVQTWLTDHLLASPLASPAHEVEVRGGLRDQVTDRPARSS